MWQVIYMKPENIHNTLPCDAGPLIPHQTPMLLVNRLIKKADDSVEGSESIIEAIVPHTGPFLKDGRLLPEYYIEVLAQAVAASDGFPYEEGKKPVISTIFFHSISNITLNQGFNQSTIRIKSHIT